MKLYNENANKVLKLLQQYFSKEQETEIANVEYPDTIEYGSNEWLIYVFYSCLLDYGTRSKIYHKNLIDTYKKYPDIFNEKNNFNEEKLNEIIRNNIHPRYPNVATKKWINLSKELAKYEDLKSKIQEFKCFSELENFVKGINGYGQKTGGLLLRLITDSNICNFNEDITTIPLDRHDIEISYLNNVIDNKKVNSKEIKMLSDIWIEAGKNLDISPSLVDKYLWQLGNDFCTKKKCVECPLNKNCKTK